MKALTYTLPLLLSAAIFAGCSQNQYAQQEYDDMYYTAQDRQQQIALEQAREEGRRQAQLEEQRRREAEAEERRRSLYDAENAQSAREINPDAAGTYSDDTYYEDDTYYQEPQATGTTGQTAVTNNYYYNGSSAYNPYGAYSPWGRTGWSSGFSISFGMGWNSWNSWCDPFWDPWCSSYAYGYGYDPYWGRPAWAWNGWGYYNPYARGYRHGFYDGYNRAYWGSYYNPRTVIVYQGERNTPRNATYGPRASRRAIASNDLGVGQRVATYDRLQNARQQRLDESIERSRSRAIQDNRVAPTQRTQRATPTTPRGGVRDGNTPRTSPRATPQERSTRPAPNRGSEGNRPRTEPARQPRPSAPATRPAPSRGDSGGGAAPTQRGGSTPRSGGRGGQSFSQLDGAQPAETSPQVAIEREAVPAYTPAPTQDSSQPQERNRGLETERYGFEQPAAVPSPQRAVRNSAAQEQHRSAPYQQGYRPAEQPATQRGGSDAPGRYAQPAQQAPISRPAPQPRQQSAPAPTYRTPAQPSYSAPSRGATYSSPQPQRSSQPAARPASAPDRSSSTTPSGSGRSGSRRGGK